AESLYNRALKIYEKERGIEDWKATGTLGELVGLYKEQKKYGDVERLYKWALGNLEKKLGPEHLSIAPLLNNFAKFYQEQKKYAEAESLYKRALAIQEKASTKTEQTDEPIGAEPDDLDPDPGASQPDDPAAVVPVAEQSSVASILNNLAGL